MMSVKYVLFKQDLTNYLTDANLGLAAQNLTFYLIISSVPLSTAKKLTMKLE